MKHTRVLALENYLVDHEPEAFEIRETKTTKRTYEAGYYVYNFDITQPINAKPLEREEAIALAKKEQAKRDERVAARKAEEEAKRQAEEARARLIAEKGPLATERQILFVLDLIAGGHHEESNPYFSEPRTREQLEVMSRKEVSLYIDSLLGRI